MRTKTNWVTGLQKYDDWLWKSMCSWTELLQYTISYPCWKNCFGMHLYSEHLAKLSNSLKYNQTSKYTTNGYTVHYTSSMSWLVKKTLCFFLPPTAFHSQLTLTCSFCFGYPLEQYSAFVWIHKLFWKLWTVVRYFSPVQEGFCLLSMNVYQFVSRSDLSCMV